MKYKPCLSGWHIQIEVVPTVVRDWATRRCRGRRLMPRIKEKPYLTNLQGTQTSKRALLLEAGALEGGAYVSTG